MSALHVLALVGAIFTGVLLLGLAFLGFLVVMKVIWFTRESKKADRARAIARAEDELAEQREKDHADRNPDVQTP